MNDLGVATGSCLRLLRAAVEEHRRLSRAGGETEPLKHVSRMLRQLVLMANGLDVDDLPPAGTALAVDLAEAIVAFGSGEAYDGEVGGVLVVDRSNVAAFDASRPLDDGRPDA